MSTCLRFMAAIALTAISSACRTDSTADESRQRTAPPPEQWINYPTPGLPRNADGTPNLAAPAPRTANCSKCSAATGRAATLEMPT